MFKSEMYLIINYFKKDAISGTPIYCAPIC